MIACMTNVRSSLIAALLAVPLAALAPPALAQEAPASTAPLTLAEAVASEVGEWTGKLEYRDYQADRWFGLPVRVAVRDGGDGVTQIRVADFDDGPRVGIVRITTVTMLGADGASGYAVSFRKGQEPELGRASLRLAEARDATHWTLIAESEASDDDRPARIRETTVRDGDTLTSLKEVDFTDDEADEWLVRNRTVLTRVE